MTHFVVVAHVAAEHVGRAGSVELAVEQLLAPYQENNMGDCPKEFLEFNDCTEEHETDYREGSCEMVKLESGELVYGWDERFRKPGAFGTGTGTHEVPEHLERVDVPHRERYATIDEFVEGWTGGKRDEETGKFGYWENPNCRWDWWKIGGRWRGFFPAKAGAALRVGEPGVFGNEPTPDRGDIVKVGELDKDRVAELERENAEKFWKKWQKFISQGGQWDGDLFDSPRSRALDIGLLRVERDGLSPGEENRSVSWEKIVRSADDSRRAWFDVWEIVSEVEFMERYSGYFSPIYTNQCLDAKGWFEAGKNGWWATSDATPETRKRFADAYFAWLRNLPPEDWLVAVDCHI